MESTAGKDGPLTQSRERLVDEVAGLESIYRFGTRAIHATGLTSLLNDLLTAAITITHADMGNVQLVDRAVAPAVLPPARKTHNGENIAGATPTMRGGVLRIECQRGFSDEFLDFFNRVTTAESACGTAMLSGEQVVVEDVKESPIFAATPALDVMLKAGARAVQSTPIITREGHLLGMFSTHYHAPHRHNELDLRLVKLLAAQAADLIQRFQAEEALRSAQLQLLSITDNMAAAVTRCSRDFRYVWVSRAYAAWLRRPKEQIEGRYIRDIIGADGYEEIRPHMERVLSGQKAEYKTQVHFSGAGNRWIHAIYVPTLTPYQVVDGWIAVVTDITDSVRQEQSLQEANEKLARANQDLSHFAFAASHDLQEPLRVVSNYAQLLVRSYNGQQIDGQAATCVRFITEGTDRMRQLLTDLLGYTQLIDDGPHALEAVDLNVVLRKVLENYRLAIEESDAKVTSDHLPTLQAYEPHFVALLQNLIDNALKYRGDRVPHIHVSAVRSCGAWQLTVADKGIGIAPEYHQSIFGLFKRLHGTAVPGTGIGLAICQRVVERYGGKIWVESQEKQGATFCFTVPVATPIAATQEA